MSAQRTGAWARVRRAANELTPEAIEQIAQRVAELLERRDVSPRVEPRRLFAANELARCLGVSREWVYDHANELGVIPIGDGPKPRLRFDLQVAEAAMAERRRGPSAAEPEIDDHAARRRRPPAQGVPLLPVRGSRSRSILARVIGAGRRWR